MGNFFQGFVGQFTYGRFVVGQGIVEADFVILTGKLSGIDAFKREGIETIVFITNNEASTFKTADLLEKASGGSGERF